MTCDERPDIFDSKQLDKCKGCPLASEKVKFCQDWGPIPNPDSDKYPSLIKQAGSLGIAAAKQLAAGMPKRSPEKIAVAMRICKQ
ncbi:hypothetical protein LCGC14_1675960, partial [marine sediment metagenome]